MQQFFFIYILNPDLTESVSVRDLPKSVFNVLRHSIDVVLLYPDLINILLLFYFSAF